MSPEETARRSFTAKGPKSHPQPKRPFMDFIYIAAGVALFAAFAGYAALLRGI